jgi:hypothetical protein
VILHARRQREEMEPLGLETLAKTRGKRTEPIRGGAESGAVAGDLPTLADPELAGIVAVWPTLSDAVKRAILDLVRVADPVRNATTDGS